MTTTPVPVQVPTPVVDPVRAEREAYYDARYNEHATTTSTKGRFG